LLKWPPFQWETPAKLIEDYQLEKIWLPPPQLYELSRLCAMNNIDEIVKFAKKRSRLGTIVMCPVQFHCKDGLVHVMPGDDLYPREENFVKPVHNMDEFRDKTRDELRTMAKNLNRAEFASLHEVVLYNNVKSSDGHVNPTAWLSSKL
jgi:nucleoside diphosphate-linked moiety X motif 19, mitochondrial